MSVPPPGVERSAEDFGPGGDRPAQPPSGAIAAAVTAIGSIALLMAMASDAVAVVGRHIGVPLIGAIELVQATVSIAGTCAIVCATIAGAHAVIHAVLDRVSPTIHAVLASFAALSAAVFFALLAVGCGWIAWDLRSGAEASDLLGIPLLPLRIFATIALGVAALTFARHAFVSRRS